MAERRAWWDNGLGDLLPSWMMDNEPLIGFGGGQQTPPPQAGPMSSGGGTGQFETSRYPEGLDSAEQRAAWDNAEAMGDVRALRMLAQQAKANTAQAPQMQTGMVGLGPAPLDEPGPMIPVGIGGGDMSPPQPLYPSQTDGQNSFDTDASLSDDGRAAEDALVRELINANEVSTPSKFQANAGMLQDPIPSATSGDIAYDAEFPPGPVSEFAPPELLNPNLIKEPEFRKSDDPDATIIDKVVNSPWLPTPINPSAIDNDVGYVHPEGYVDQFADPGMTTGTGLTTATGMMPPKTNPVDTGGSTAGGVDSPGGTGGGNSGGASTKDNPEIKLNKLQQFAKDKFGWDEDKRGMMSKAMMSAGAGMMQGNSQFALQNIGAGLQDGIDTYTGEQGRHRQMSLDDQAQAYKDEMLRMAQEKHTSSQAAARVALAKAANPSTTFDPKSTVGKLWADADAIAQGSRGTMTTEDVLNGWIKNGFAKDPREEVI